MFVVSHEYHYVKEDICVELERDDDVVVAEERHNRFTILCTAWQWFQTNANVAKNADGKTVVRLRTSDETTIEGNPHIYILANGGPSVTKLTLQQRQRKFKSLENLEVHYDGIYEIIFKSEDWPSSTCTCVIFLKKIACKHIFAIPCIKKLAVFDDLCKTIPIGHKRGPGRPRKLKPKEALIREEKLTKRRRIR